LVLGDDGSALGWINRLPRLYAFRWSLRVRIFSVQLAISAFDYIPFGFRWWLLRFLGFRLWLLNWLRLWRFFFLFECFCKVCKLIFCLVLFRNGWSCVYLLIECCNLIFKIKSTINAEFVFRFGL